MSIFGVIVSGRLVQTNFERISEKQFLITIPEADNINHIVVFLTGCEPFPDGTGGQVFFSWPDPENPPNWQALGFITNEKPSAIFKISTLKKLDEMNGFENSFAFGQQNINHNAQIGISIEPILGLQEGIRSRTNENFVDFAKSLVQNFVNFVSSFTVTQSQMTENPNEIYVPLSTVQNWCVTFERRISQNWRNWKM